MKKSTHTPHYEAVTQCLIDMRAKAGITQRELADRLGREHSFVWRIEKGERRLDLVEFFWVCQALGQNPDTAYKKLTATFTALEN